MLEELRKLMDLPIYGNAYSDMPLFKLAHSIIENPLASRSQRMAAMRRIGEAMGIQDSEPVTNDNFDKLLEDYIQCCGQGGTD